LNDLGKHSDTPDAVGYALSSVPRICGAVCVIGMLVAAWFLVPVNWMPGGADWSVERMREWADHSRGWAVAGSIALMTLHSFLPVPAELLAVGNGIVFGPVAGIAVTWSGAMIGAVLSFGLARRLGRPALRYLLSDAHCTAIETWQGRSSNLLLARLVPLISFNLINYAAGVSGVGWWMFLWTTGIGILPITMLSVVLGESLFDGAWYISIGVAGALIIVAAGLPRLAKRKIKIPTPQSGNS